MMRYLAIALLLLASGAAQADYAVTAGSGTTIFAFTCFTSKVCPSHVPINSSGTEIFTASAPGSAKLTDGTNAVAVKSASTAPVATDPALVVSISQNAGLFSVSTPGYVNAIGTAQGASTASINGGLVLCNNTTAAAGGSNTTSNAINCTTAGGLRIDGYSWGGTALGTPTNFGTSPGAVVAGSVNASVMYGTTAAVADPCKTVAKTTLAIDQAADTQIISGTSSKKTYICSLALVAATAETVSLVVGTGTVCATNIVAMLGSTTDSQGVSLAANGGLTFGNGDATVFGGLGSNADNVCIRQGATARIAGTLTYVQN